MHDYPGKLIVFDGPDGGGKTTQARSAQDRLEYAGKKMLHLREPGGTDVGEAVRTILLHPQHKDMTLRTELLLYQASRAQLVETRIIPALKNGEYVLLDRFYSATFAYQVIAGDLPKKKAMNVIDFATLGLRPDLALIFDLPPEAGLARCGKRELDRIEQRDLGYHRRVRQGFLEYAQLNPDNTVVIDATRTVHEIQADVQKILEDRVLD